MCEVLGVSPSGYYDYLKRLEREETEREAFNRHLDERILFHFTDNHGIYGSPRIHKRLERIDNINVSERKVTKRMSELNLYATRRKEIMQTTDLNQTDTVYKNQL